MKDALVVGIDAYSDFSGLRFCENDATSLADILEDSAYGYRVTRLLGKQATRVAITKALRTLFSNTAASYLFYFAGHGYVLEPSSFLASVDGSVDDPGVDFDLLRRLVADLAPKHASVILILDCCHSGGAEARAAARPKVKTVAIQQLDHVLQGLPPSRALLAACLGEELALEDANLKHGVFTAYLLDGLLGEATDMHGDVTVPSLYDYISSRFSATTNQTPVLKGEFRGRFIIGTQVSRLDKPILPEQALSEIEQQAGWHLEGYQSEYGLLERDQGQWQRSGFVRACRDLETIKEWFHAQVTAEPTISRRPRFKARLADLMQEVGRLSDRVRVGVTVERGPVVDIIGSGNFGTVWKVKSQELPPLAYKVFHSASIHNEEKIKRFEQGYYSAKKLDHPNIVRVMEFTRCPIGFYMDFIDGPDLSEVGPSIDEPVAQLRILITVAKSIAYAHKRDVIHRDIKPQNIVMRYTAEAGQWEPFLTDFDLAWYPTAQGQLTQVAGGGMGTVQYSAPEQLKGTNAALVRAKEVDSYAFAQVCFFLAVGRDPTAFASVENGRNLAVCLKKGWNRSASEEFSRLYGECSNDVEPSLRPNFPEIVQRLTNALNVLIGAEERVYSGGHFARELIFMVTVSPEQYAGEESAFKSQSGSLRVGIQIDASARGDLGSLKLDLHAQHASFGLPGVPREKLRTTLLGRIDRGLEKYAGRATKMPGNVNPFQVFVYLGDVPLNNRGLVEAASFVREMITIVSS